jgi:hypothetical protein
MTQVKVVQLVLVNRILTGLVIGLALLAGYLWTVNRPAKLEVTSPSPTTNIDDALIAETGSLALPKPEAGDVLNRLLGQNRFTRRFTEEAVSIKDMSNILWAGQGVNTTWGDRVVPSIRSQYPLTLWVWVRRVEGMDSGLYVYQPENHELMPVRLTQEPEAAVYSHSSMIEAPLVLVATYEATDPADTQAVWLEAGGVAENIMLAAQHRGLGGLILIEGKEKSRTVLGLSPDIEVAWQIPIGRRAVE